MRSPTKQLSFPVLKFLQGKYSLVVFSADARTIWNHFAINRRLEDKDEGYQRTLKEGRVRKIARYIESGNALPLGILVSMEKGKYKIEDDHIEIVDEPDVGWIIDGQHRVAGAHEAKIEIDIPVVAFLELDLEEQIRQFVTVNREAKGVPASLYYDLLSHLPAVSPANRAKERAVDIAHSLRDNEESPFYSRIVAITSPKRGELSLSTFASKVSSLVVTDKGILSSYTFEEQSRIIDNYYRAMKNVFPAHFKEEESVFFRTTGFRALIRVFPSVFSYALKAQKGFTVADVMHVLGNIKDFDFDTWKKIGTGNAAEIQAADELRSEMEDMYTESGDAAKIRL